MKTYYLTLSQTFPATHPRKGEPTYFYEKYRNARLLAAGMCIGYSVPLGQPHKKLHTIRANYPLWRERFEQIEAGKAILYVRYWTGKPYHSKQMEICKLTKKDGIGLQRLFFNADRDGQHVWWNFNIDGRYDVVERLAANDGLSLDDWKAWFKSYDLSKPLAIIHFTSFRY